MIIEHGYDVDVSDMEKEVKKIKIFFDQSYVGKIRRQYNHLKGLIDVNIVTPFYDKYYYILTDTMRKAKEDVSCFYERVKMKLMEYPMLTGFLAVLPIIGFIMMGISFIRNKNVSSGVYKDEEEKNYRTEISDSGDKKTQKRQQYRTEISESGDKKTQKRQHYRTEISGSGDQKTLRKQHYRTELEDTESMTRKQIRSNRFKTLQSEQEEVMDLFVQSEDNKDVVKTSSVSVMQAQMATDTNALSVSTKIIMNTYTMECEIDDRWCAAIKINFLKGKVALTARHVRPFIERSSRVRIYNKYIKYPHIFDSKTLTLENICNAAGEEKDQMLIAFPVAGMNDHANIVGSLSDGTQMSMFKTTRAALVVPFNDGVMMKFGNVRAYDVAQPLEYELPISSGVQKMFIRDRYEYSGLETTTGDCGSFLIAINSQLPRKILGIHVAGKWDKGISSPINVNDITRAMEKLPWAAQLEIVVGNDTKVETVMDGWIPEGNFVPFGKTPTPVLGASSSKIIPSLVHDAITKHTTIPSKLKPFTLNGVKLNPMEIGLKKAGAKTIQLNGEILDQCIEDVKRIVNSKIEKGLYDKVFDDLTSVTGIEGDPYMAPIERKTSPGYPWILQRDGKTGKSKWLGKDLQYFVHPELKEKSDERIALAREGKRLLTVWIDTLKDERRPVEKVNAGKTRVFAAGPMDYTFTFRKYFMGFAAHVMKNRIDNEISVGTNVYSPDWTKTAKKLQSKGNKIIAGDFSNFDGTLVADILYKILDIINDFYDDGEENARIRRVLWAEIVNSVHLCGDNLYMWTHSQPSGCPITAILNSIYNSVSMRYVWMLIVEPGMRNMKEFNKHVSMISYGDDNVVNISDEVIDVFNQVTIAEGYEQLGMTYTDELKSGKMIPFRELSEVGYLKRKFVWDKDEMQYLAPLDLNTTLEMVNWIRGELDAEEATRLNLEASAFELSLHGKEVFEEWIQKYRNASRYFEERPMFLSHFQYRYEEMVKYGLIAGMC